MQTKEAKYLRHRTYQLTPEARAKRIAYDKMRYSLPEVVARTKAHRQLPEVKARLKISNQKYRKTEKYRLYRKQYRGSDKAKNVRRNQLLQKNFGITLDVYNKMLADQKGVCAICFSKESVRMLAVDHCHKTGKIRGLLCRFCNQALGQFNDDIGRLHRAIIYLNLTK